MPSDGPPLPASASAADERRCIELYKQCVTPPPPPPSLRASNQSAIDKHVAWAAQGQKWQLVLG
eukprot:SAG31_NODE_635_length_13360_cov_4.229847_9_plen_64_part_00